MFLARRKYDGLILPLSEYSESKILVLFVHGLAGNIDSWEYFGELLKTETEILKSIDLAFYDYPTALIANPLKKYPSLIDVADGLRSFVTVKCSKYSKIILVCHSMGGLIARKFVLEDVMSLTPLNVKSLLLYATPNTGSDIANFTYSIYRYNIHITQLRKGSEFIRELDRNWVRFSVNERVAIKFIVAGADKIVDQESARGHWGEFSIEVDIGKTHKNIIKVRSKEDLSYQVLINEIKRIIESLQTEEDEEDYEDLENDTYSEGEVEGD